MPVIALWSPSDLLTSVLTPIALASTRRPSLMIDLDPSGPRFGGTFTLADLVRDSPTKAQLDSVPGRTAVLANGGVQSNDAGAVVGALCERWPFVVLRCDPSEPPPRRAVPVIPLLPEPFSMHAGRAGVFQSLGLGAVVAGVH